MSGESTSTNFSGSVSSTGENLKRRSLSDTLSDALNEAEALESELDSVSEERDTLLQTVEDLKRCISELEVENADLRSGASE